MATLDRDTLEAALIGYEQQKRAIDSKITLIKAQLSGGQAPAVAAPKARKGRRKFSAETRAKMAAAQKRRWAAKQARE